MKAFLLAVSIVSLGACARSGPQSCAAPDVDFEQLFMTNYVAPFREGRAADWAKIFADDAVGLHNRRPADVGHASIEAFGNLVANTFTLPQYDVRVTETRVGCDMAWTRGEYQTRMVFRDSGEPAPWGPQTGKFLVIWRKQADGEWKIEADMGNSSE